MRRVPAQVAQTRDRSGVVKGEQSAVADMSVWTAAIRRLALPLFRVIRSAHSGQRLPMTDVRRPLTDDALPEDARPARLGMMR